MDAYIMRTATIRLVAGLVVGVTLLAPWEIGRAHV